MSKHTKYGNRWVRNLQTIGPILVLIGAILFEPDCTKPYSGWLVAIGGGMAAIVTLLQISSKGGSEEKRIRRLDRMSFIGLLIYLVSGGFMIQGSNIWLPLFAVATVFYIYALFAKDRALRKENKS
ncbi:MAG: hypothetical protein PUJ69_03430 [Porphyromonas somerae]|uniref:hypothetical protein n=1 Tax=Porphyromonas somerae TaxID=322095 RepID=UPI0026F2EA0F|nr:hypothetical protein [Porphyromonas somerae]MDD7557705.1 hypothetical protein [Porphyromonas somerae]MDY3883741.1 hypothetical protein [Porphyromonas somerae]MDY5815365.1 hypothetical protein [Porphyromonas somerae]